MSMLAMAGPRKVAKARKARVAMMALAGSGHSSGAAGCTPKAKVSRQVEEARLVEGVALNQHWSSA